MNNYLSHEHLTQTPIKDPESIEIPEVASHQDIYVNIDESFGEEGSINQENIPQATDENVESRGAEEKNKYEQEINDLKAEIESLRAKLDFLEKKKVEPEIGIKVRNIERSPGRLRRFMKRVRNVKDVFRGILRIKGEGINGSDGRSDEDEVLATEKRASNIFPEQNIDAYTQPEVEEVTKEKAVEPDKNIDNDQGAVEPPLGDEETVSTEGSSDEEKTKQDEPEEPMKDNIQIPEVESKVEKKFKALLEPEGDKEQLLDYMYLIGKQLELDDSLIEEGPMIALIKSTIESQREVDETKYNDVSEMTKLFTDDVIAEVFEKYLS